MTSGEEAVFRYAFLDIEMPGFSGMGWRTTGFTAQALVSL